jgi:AcrR family transcriptional regulator
VAQAQRERLVRAVIAAAAEVGYADTTVADIVRRARVSRSAFYDHFTDKEHCFLAATADACEVMFTTISTATQALDRRAPALEHARVGLRAYLGFLADEPEFARCLIIEAYAAGPRSLEGIVVAQERFADNMREWHRRARRAHPQWPAVPREVHGALVGAIHQLVVGHVRGGRTAELPDLEDIAFRLHLAVYLGWA